MPDEITGENTAVLESVKKDIEGIKDDSHKQFERLKKSMADFQADHTRALDEGKTETGEVKEKLDKFATDITTRMQALQDDQTKRMDDIETRMARTPDGESLVQLSDEKDVRAAQELKMLQFKREGKAFDESDLVVTRDEIKAYEAAYRKYLRIDDRDPARLGELHMKALYTGSDPDGGYFVSPAISSRVAELRYESTPLRGMATVEKITTDQLDMAVDNDQAGAEWIGETATPSNVTTPDIAKKSISVHEMATRPKATLKQLEDSAWDVEGWLARKVSAKFGRTEATAFTTGDGVAKPRGFLTYATGSTWGTIEQVLTGVSASYNYAGLINIMTSLKEYYLANAKWITNRASVAKFLQLVDGASQYIFAPSMLSGPGGAKVFSPTLLGFPLVLGSDMPTLAADSLSVVFGDFREAYTIVDRLGVTVQRDPYTAKPFVEFYTRARVGGDVTNFEAIKIGKCNAS